MKTPEQIDSMLVIIRKCWNKYPERCLGEVIADATEQALGYRIDASSIRGTSDGDLGVGLLRLYAARK